MPFDSTHILPRYEVVRDRAGGFNVYDVHRREVCHATWTEHLHVAQRWARALNESYASFIDAGRAITAQIAADCVGRG